MPSELREIKTQLSWFVRDRWYFKRVIEPCPNISVSKEVHTQESHQIGKRPGELCTQREVLPYQHGDECCLNLNFHRVGTGSNKGLYLEVLFECLKKQFDLPAILIEGGNSSCRERV